jgi:hypothetical protein
LILKQYRRCSYKALMGTSSLTPECSTPCALLGSKGSHCASPHLPVQEKA